MWKRIDESRRCKQKRVKQRVRAIVEKAYTCELIGPRISCVSGMVPAMFETLLLESFMALSPVTGFETEIIRQLRRVLPHDQVTPDTILVSFASKTARRRRVLMNIGICP